MKIRPIFDSTVSASATVNGTAYRMDASGNDDSVIVVQFFTNGGTLNDIKLQGRLSVHSSGATTWVDLTSGAGGGIQIVPRCLEYRAVVTNTNASAIPFACWLGL